MYKYNTQLLSKLIKAIKDNYPKGPIATTPLDANTRSASLTFSIPVKGIQNWMGELRLSAALTDSKTSNDDIDEIFSTIARFRHLEKYLTVHHNDSHISHYPQIILHNQDAFECALLALFLRAKLSPNIDEKKMEILSDKINYPYGELLSLTLNGYIDEKKCLALFSHIHYDKKIFISWLKILSEANNPIASEILGDYYKDKLRFSFYLKPSEKTELRDKIKSYYLLAVDTSDSASLKLASLLKDVDSKQAQYWEDFYKSKMLGSDTPSGKAEILSTSQSAKSPKICFFAMPSKPLEKILKKEDRNDLDIPDDKIPAHFRCPITLQLMEDPVKTKFNTIYERGAIEAWFKKQSSDPLYGLELKDTTLIPDDILRSEIETFKMNFNSSNGPTLK